MDPSLPTNEQIDALDSSNKDAVKEFLATVKETAQYVDGSTSSLAKMQQDIRDYREGRIAMSKADADATVSELLSRWEEVSANVENLAKKVDNDFRVIRGWIAKKALPRSTSYVDRQYRRPLVALRESVDKDFNSLGAEATRITGKKYSPIEIVSRKVPKKEVPIPDKPDPEEDTGKDSDKDKDTGDRDPGTGDDGPRRDPPEDDETKPDDPPTSGSGSGSAGGDGGGYGGGGHGGGRMDEMELGGDGEIIPDDVADGYFPSDSLDLPSTMSGDQSDYKIPIKGNAVIDVVPQYAPQPVKPGLIYQETVVRMFYNKRTLNKYLSLYMKSSEWKQMSRGTKIELLERYRHLVSNSSKIGIADVLTGSESYKDIVRALLITWALNQKQVEIDEECCAAMKASNQPPSGLPEKPSTLKHKVALIVDPTVFGIENLSVDNLARLMRGEKVIPQGDVKNEGADDDGFPIKPSKPDLPTGDRKDDGKEETKGGKTSPDEEDVSRMSLFTPFSSDFINRVVQYGQQAGSKKEVVNPAETTEQSKWKIVDGVRVMVKNDRKLPRADFSNGAPSEYMQDRTGTPLTVASDYFKRGQSTSVVTPVIQPGRPRTRLFN